MKEVTIMKSTITVITREGKSYTWESNDPKWAIEFQVCTRHFAHMWVNGKAIEVDW